MAQPEATSVDATNYLGNPLGEHVEHLHVAIMAAVRKRTRPRRRPGEISHMVSLEGDAQAAPFLFSDDTLVDDATFLPRARQQGPSRGWSEIICSRYAAHTRTS
jgi:hypothetical protein